MERVISPFVSYQAKKAFQQIIREGLLNNGRFTQIIEDELLSDERFMEQIFVLFVSRLVELQRGEPGEKGEKGETGESGEPGADGRDGADGLPGIDGADGRAGLDGIDGKDGTDGKDGENGKDGSPDTPEQIVTKLQSVKEPWLDASVIRNLPTPEIRKRSRGGGGMSDPRHESFSMSGATSVTLARDVAAGGNAIIVRYQGQTLDMTTHYTISGRTVSFTFAPVSGATISVTYWPA